MQPNVVASECAIIVMIWPRDNFVNIVGRFLNTPLYSLVPLRHQDSSSHSYDALRTWIGGEDR